MSSYLDDFQNDPTNRYEDRRARLLADSIALFFREDADFALVYEATIRDEITQEITDYVLTFMLPYDNVLMKYSIDGRSLTVIFESIKIQRRLRDEVKVSRQIIPSDNIRYNGSEFLVNGNTVVPDRDYTFIATPVTVRKFGLAGARSIEEKREREREVLKYCLSDREMFNSIMSSNNELRL